MNKTLKYSLLLPVIGLAMAGCQDSWDDHYGQQPDTQYGTSSLYEVIAAQPELSDFCRVLSATKVFANNKQTDVTYKDLLGTDQFFTVWAPANGTFDADALISQCQTATGDSLVELQFLKNHITRFSYSYTGKNRTISMMNSKSLDFDGTTFGGVEVQKSNVAARNGLLHVIEKPISYYYNIYEALVSLPKYQHIGNFMHSYQIDEFDEYSSLAMGIVDGKTVYVDSVFYSYNKLMWQYGYIDAEDSTYWMLVPNKEVWDSLYAESYTYYNYSNYFGSEIKCDSAREYWANYALLQDLVFNPKPTTQFSIKDSITSTTWYPIKNGPQYHVYYKPFEEGGLFAQQWADSLVCSNGTIYEMEGWPFAKEDTYFRKIIKEGESSVAKSEDPSATGKLLSMSTQNVQQDSISNGYIVLTPKTASSQYFVEYELKSVLSGKYDVCVVMLPKSVDPSNDMSPETTNGKRNRRSNKFIVDIMYKGTDGKPYQVSSKSRYTYDPTTPSYYTKAADSNKSVDFLFDCNLSPDQANNRSFINNPLVVDTVKLCTMHFPTCNYNVDGEISERIRITNNIKGNETNSYNHIMYIDCVLLIPHKDEVDN